MSLRRIWTSLFALMVLSFSLVAGGEGLNDVSAGVQKDDSQLTVVDAKSEGTAPIVDTASKSKKKPPSFWNKLAHPTKWFSSTKAKK